MKQSQSDPVIDEIREVRHRISARFEHDPNGLVAYYGELQKGYQDRLKPKKIKNYNQRTEKATKHKSAA